MNTSCETTQAGPCVCRLAITIGIVFGAAMLILGLITTKTETYGHELVKVIGSVYWYYEPGSTTGAFWGGLWGFLDGFVGTIIAAMIYYTLKKMGPCCCCGRTGNKEANTETKPKHDTDISRDSVQDGGDA